MKIKQLSPKKVQMPKMVKMMKDDFVEDVVREKKSAFVPKDKIRFYKK